jgi:hypothetical protein
MPPAYRRWCSLRQVLTNRLQDVKPNFSSERTLGDVMINWFRLLITEKTELPLSRVLEFQNPNGPNNLKTTKDTYIIHCQCFAIHNYYETIHRGESSVVTQDIDLIHVNALIVEYIHGIPLAPPMHIRHVKYVGTKAICMNQIDMRSVCISVPSN